MNADDLVWFDDESDFYRAGTIVDIQDSVALVLCDGETQSHEIDLRHLKPREDTGANGVEDMIGLKDLHEGSVIHNLKKRFFHNNTYTYVGNILFSVNPYQLFDIYSLGFVRMYENKLIGKLPPHIFALGNACQYNMLKENKDQVVLFSGDSGSGKTEATKLFMRYLAATNTMSINLITEQILESSPLLESFGNAKTVINDNSSRFGKYIEIIFENGRISGAVMTEYLLEKSRIVYQNPGDRNFHIFYEMLAGLPLEDKKDMGLDIADTFFYLNQGSNSNLVYKNDEQDFQNVVAAMEVLGVDPEERHGIFSILAAILHIGNIYYGRTQRNGQEAAVIMNNIEVEFIAKLLQVDIAGVAKSLTQRITDAGGERFHLPFNVEEALDSRDGLARALYSRLFTWLVSKINQICAVRNEFVDHLKVAILDIFGFETFRMNGFEQLCINYANESLQSFFIEHIFKQEQEEYDLEGIKLPPIEFYDNQPCLDLIGKSPIGIIHLLADESCFPQSSDRSFLEKCHQHHARNELYIKPKYTTTEFGIHHYAGEVTYQVDMFLDKNRDLVRPELMELLLYSKSIFIANLFPEFLANPNIHLSQSAFMSARHGGLIVPDKRYKLNYTQKATVIGTFSESLKSLIERMKECSAFFVRCIRPNLDKSPVIFEEPLVMSQIHSSGVIDTIKIRQSGYPIRLYFKNFVKRYFCLCQKPKLNLKNPEKENAKKIVDQILMSVPEMRSEFSMGEKKLFLREAFEVYLEDVRHKILKDNAAVIQNSVRRWLKQSEYQRKRNAVVVLQSHTRGFLARRKVSRARRGIVKFQALYRMYKSRKFFVHNKTNELNRISKRQREFLAQVHYADKLEYDKVVDVTRFDIPPDLAVVLTRLNHWEPLHLDYHVCSVENVTQWDFAENTLPGDIDLCYFSKFARLYFQDTMSLTYKRVPIRSSLLKQKYTDIIDAVLAFKLIMRFMDDRTMNGLRQLVLGNYIVNKGIRQFELRDEIYSQLIIQTRENPNEHSLRRGWLLFALCICCFPPTPRMNKYLLKYVSDHGIDDFKSYCQRKLLCWEVDSPGRIFPPTLLEWKALKEMASISLACEMSDGYERVIEVESSSKGENLAKSFLHLRDVADTAVSGWSFYLQFERSCRLDICGDDTVLDLISVLEQPQGFPCSMAHSCISLDRSNPMPAGRKETVIEAHKSYTHRTRLERLRQVYSEELALQPLIYQQEPDEVPFFQRRAAAAPYLDEHLEESSYKQRHRQPVYMNVDALGFPRWRGKENGGYFEHERMQQDRYLRDRFHEKQQEMNELEEAFNHRVLARKKQQSPPPAPPPPPPSNPNSASSSKANTLSRKNHQKPKYDLDEVLQRSIELKFKREQKGTFRSQDTQSTSLSDETQRFNGRKNSKEKTYTVAEMLSQNEELLDLSDDIRANDKTLPRSRNRKVQPSILSASSASLSRSSKNRLANIANQFEHRKNNYPVSSRRVSAYVDNIFNPVFADEEDSQSETLLTRLRGGGQNAFYPHRKKQEITYNNSHIYSNVNSTDPQSMLINQLSQQQQYLQNQLYSVKRAGYPHWNNETLKRLSDERMYVPPRPRNSPPPLPPGYNNFNTPHDNNKSLRQLPVGIQEVIKGIEENNGDVSFDNTRSIYSIKNEWIDHDQVLHSVLYNRPNLPFLTYSNTRWKMCLKKEIFYPNEIMNVTLKHLIYRQILDDLGSRTCCRLSSDDRYKMQRLLAKTMTQESVIFAAKEFPLYFSRLYRVNGYAERSVSTYLAVSHSGLRLVTRENIEDQLKTTAHFRYIDVVDVNAAKDKLMFETPVKKFVLHTVKAPNIKKLIDIYMKAAEKHAKYVQALNDYTAPGRDHLSFKKGAVIRIYEHKDNDPGLLWGTLGDYRGKFPATIVEDHDNTVSGWGPPVVPRNQASNHEPDTEPYSMMEFAMRYYRLPELSEAGKLDSIRKNLSAKDDEWAWNYVSSLVVFGKEPISGSLINFNNKSTSRQAADIFKVVMRFMGDLKRDKQETNAELISTILKTGIEVLDMRDEIFCQLAKQTTNNKSDNRESCSRGWKLLMLCTAYFDCSELLRPFLNKYFHSAGDPKRDFHTAANICELNLSRSFKYGGRKQMPSESELFMFMQGKHAKHQIVELPGSIQKLCKVQTSTTAYDLVKDICQEMGLHSEEEHEEYGLYIFFNEQQLLVPVQETDYVFDAFAQIERESMKFAVTFRKVIWYQTMRFGNHLFTEVIYNQVLPDVMNGYVLHFKGNRASHIRDQQTQNEISLLAALQHRVKNNHAGLSVEEIPSLIPPLVFNFLSPAQWLHTVQDHYRLIRHFTVINARTKFLELISAWAYFGSSFFYVQNCEHISVDGPCILAINKTGVQMLATHSRDTLLSFSYSEIISTRHLRTDSGRLFVDLKTGNLMVQKVTRLETPRGKEISNLIARYIRCLSVDAPR